MNASKQDNADPFRDTNKAGMPISWKEEQLDDGMNSATLRAYLLSFYELLTSVGAKRV
jgi:hypothetical protein